MLAQGRMQALKLYRHRLLWINILSFTMLFKAPSGRGRWIWLEEYRKYKERLPMSQSGTDLPHEERVLSAFTMLQIDWVSVFLLLLLHLLLLQSLVRCVFTISKLNYIKCIHLHFISVLGKLKFFSNTETSEGHHVRIQHQCPKPSSTLQKGLRVTKCPHTSCKCQTESWYHKGQDRKKSLCGNGSSAAHHKIVQQKPDSQLLSWSQDQRSNSHSLQWPDLAG